jgi:hypothetical protein
VVTSVATEVNFHWGWWNVCASGEPTAQGRGWWDFRVHALGRKSCRDAVAEETTWTSVVLKGVMR